jgi:hypothetical protein
MECGNCGNKNATRWMMGAFGERCEGCAHIRVPKRSKMTFAMTKYIKSRYIGPDGMVKCDPKYKPSEHYLGD